MTPTQYLAALDKLGWTTQQAAQYLGIGWRQSFRYAAGDQPISESVALLLRMYLKHGANDD